MDRAPKALTNDEINEITSIKDVQDMWGAEGADEMASILREQEYTVKFDYISGGPGYVGDLYMIFGDFNPLFLIRRNGQLQISR